MNAAECSICSQDAKTGIKLFNNAICRECEEDILNVDIKDIKYEYYKVVIKKMWIDYILAFT
ncbi:MAG: sigma-G inhibitor, Gin [Firmicutes bacterium]|nr:sigma-G inhibitor, Gin [Bacillota bacterium]